MAKGKRPKDQNQLAKMLVDQLTGEDVANDNQKRSMTVAEAGRLGGLKGGKARDLALSDKRKREIARKAANARWGKT